MAEKINFSEFLREHFNSDILDMLQELYKIGLDPVVMTLECKYNDEGEKNYYSRVSGYLDEIRGNELDIIERIKDVTRRYNVFFTIEGEEASIAIMLEGDILDIFLDKLAGITCQLPLYNELVAVVALSPLDGEDLNLEISYCWFKDNIVIDEQEMAKALLDSLESDADDEYYMAGISSSCECRDGVGLSIVVPDTSKFTVNGEDIVLNIEKLKANLEKIIMKSKKNIVEKLGINPEDIEKEYVSIKSLDPFLETLPEEEIIDSIYSIGYNNLKRVDCSCRDTKRVILLLKKNESIIIVDLIPVKDDIYMKIECDDTDCEEKLLLEFLRQYYKKRIEKSEKYIERLIYKNLIRTIESGGSLLQLINILNKTNNQNK